MKIQNLLPLQAPSATSLSRDWSLIGIKSSTLPPLAIYNQNLTPARLQFRDRSRKDNFKTTPLLGNRRLWLLQSSRHIGTDKCLDSHRSRRLITLTFPLTCLRSQFCLSLITRLRVRRRYRMPLFRFYQDLLHTYQLMFRHHKQIFYNTETQLIISPTSEKLLETITQTMTQTYLNHVLVLLQTMTQSMT